MSPDHKPGNVGQKSPREVWNQQSSSLLVQEGWQFLFYHFGVEYDPGQ